jgi:hypothetical protein
MAESVEGLANSHITYNLKATITRGTLGCESSINAYRPVRFVQAPHLATLGLASSVAVADIWPDKIRYQFSIA